jgi:hypothetical protein
MLASPTRRLTTLCHRERPEQAACRSRWLPCRRCKLASLPRVAQLDRVPCGGKSWAVGGEPDRYLFTVSSFLIWPWLDVPKATTKKVCAPWSSVGIGSLTFHTLFGKTSSRLLWTG